MPARSRRLPAPPRATRVSRRVWTPPEPDIDALLTVIEDAVPTPVSTGCQMPEMPLSGELSLAERVDRLNAMIAVRGPGKKRRQLLAEMDRLYPARRVVAVEEAV